MTTSIDRILSAVTSGELPREWADARAGVAAQRERVEHLLNSNPKPRVYGFTTLLGQLDAVDVSTVDQHELFAQHLLGPLSTAPAEILRLVTLCKIEQLHHGGSGISGETFEAVLAAAVREPASARGAWLSSYGAGDVVPAAWWIDATLGTNAVDALRQGDLIALLNGNFFSSALAVSATLSLIDVAAEFLSACTALVSLPESARATTDAALGTVYSLFPPTAADGKPQLPLSRRDARSYVDPTVHAIEAMALALNRRLSKASANPLFIETSDGGTSAESQSSFLDVDLTFAATSLTQLGHLMLAASQRMIVGLCDSALATSSAPEPRFVQPPKVAMALVERAQLSAVLPSRFGGSESSGVEDLRDLSLLSVEALQRVVILASDCVALLNEVLTMRDVEPFADAAEFKHVLIGRLMSEAPNQEMVDVLFERGGSAARALFS